MECGSGVCGASAFGYKAEAPQTPLPHSTNKKGLGQKPEALDYAVLLRPGSFLHTGIDVAVLRLVREFVLHLLSDL